MSCRCLAGLSAGGRLWLTGRGEDSAIHDAVIENDLAEVRRLLSAEPACVGARDDIVSGPTASPEMISWQGSTPLHLAADRGHLEIAKLLLAAGADKTAQVSCSLRIGLQRHHARVLDGRLTAGRGRADAAADRRDARAGRDRRGAPVAVATRRQGAHRTGGTRTHAGDYPQLHGQISYLRDPARMTVNGATVRDKPLITISCVIYNLCIRAARLSTTYTAHATLFHLPATQRP